MRRSGQSEVESLHLAVARNKDILRLQIAVDDFLLVRRQATRHLSPRIAWLAHRRCLGRILSRNLSPSNSPVIDGIAIDNNGLLFIPLPV